MPRERHLITRFFLRLTRSGPMPPFLVRTIWLASAAVTLLLLSQPLGTDVQLEMSLGELLLFRR